MPSNLSRTAAFEALGYKLHSVRSDWSAEKADGVCITIWEKEIHSRDGVSSFDSRVDAQPIQGWGHKPGNKLRKVHLARAMSEFEGKVDVVIVHGTPGEGVRSGSPWQPTIGWRVTYFDPESGHLAAQVDINGMAARSPSQ